MSEGLRLSDLSAVRLALMADDARAQAAPILRADPIAIVGMACRAPGGVATPDEFWRLLAAGAQTTGPVPADRFDGEGWYDSDPSAPGKSLTKRASFLDQIDLFDADYFGILGREAEQLDPQQRLVLEAAIEAIDDAGAPHSTLRGSRAGVFMACYHSDYARLVYEDPGALDTRSLSGTIHGLIANRISHFLDLRGPSLTLDTGCSSSLVAIHLACQSLRLGETDFALAGGVSVIINPELFVAMTKVGFMAPDGQCKTFDARADGFGRGEGCGVVALKRLSDAIADGDRVLAVIRGSAVNQDGRSTVLTAPNGKAQEALIRDALEAAALPPGRISFIEAHGTGTALGDPLEVEAIASVLGHAGEGALPCYLGSAKANIGHLEAAAGVLGLIKAVQAIRRGQIPPQPNFETLNPHITLKGTRLSVPATLTEFPQTGSPRCAAVSSFGMGGTNAHVVLEQAPDLPRPAVAAPEAIWTLPLSAKSAEGLADLVQAWTGLLDDPEAGPIEDLCFTASGRRTHYPVRLAVVGKDKAELRARLAAAGAQHPVGAPAPGPPRLGFVFSGQGSQWWGMGRELLDAEPVFKSALQACDTAIAAVAGWSVIEELTKPEAKSRIAETAIAQPALFALQTSLAALWAQWGVRPAAVAGHSVGEIAAFHVAGLLSLEEAARIVVRRGAIMQAATGGGRMAAVGLSQAEALAVAAEHAGKLDLAAVNGPRSTVLSGEASALEAAVAALVAKGVSARALQVDYAFHSVQMTALAGQLGGELGPVSCSTPQAKIFSTLTGAALHPGMVDAAYFADAIRKPVRFADAVAAMRQAGVDAFLEIGPHPTLAAAMTEVLEERPPRAIAASLRRGRNEPETLRQGLAALYGAGVDPDWAAVQPAEGVPATLPAYPWRRRRYWISRRPMRRLETLPADWLGAPVQVAGAGLTVFPVDPGAIAGWVGDHRIMGDVVVPGAAILQALAAAAGAASQGAETSLRDFLIGQPLRMEGQADRWQIVASGEGAEAQVSFHAQASPQAPWRLIAEAKVAAKTGPAQPAPFKGGDAADLPGFYEGLAGIGIDFGPAFQILDSAVCAQGQAEGSATLPADLSPGPGLHPALLDAGLQLATLARGAGEGAFLPLSIDSAWMRPQPATTLSLRATVTESSQAAFSADVFAYAGDGDLVAALRGVRFVKADPARFAGQAAKAADLYQVDWAGVTAAASSPVATETWIVLEDAVGTAAAFAAALEARGAKAQRVAARDPAAALASPDASVACFWPLDMDGTADDHTAYGPVLKLVQALGAAPPRRLVLITCGATGLDAVCIDEAAAMRGAGLAALVRTAGLEYPGLSVQTVDIDPLATPEDAARGLLRALNAQAEPELAVRREELRAPRLRRLGLGPDPGPVAVIQSGEGLDGVAPAPAAALRPGPGELLVRVRAAGLNFRDVLVALGAYPGGPAPFGGECAGYVQAVGPGVKGFKIGDAVASLAQGALASHAVVRADLTIAVPDGLGLDVAGASPVAFLTADIGLRRLARIQPGDRVLIHAATGGVGLAALALAEQAGAEVFATAGSPEKRAYLRRRGVACVFDSRTLDFADQILAATDGKGVRVVLNSLTGRFVEASLRALAPDGVFLELGKREIWTPQEVAAARPDVAYHVFDAGLMAQADPSLYQDALREVFAAMTRGEIAALPVAARPLSAAGKALREMAQARHMGKIVLLPEADPSQAAPVRGDGAYLVTGGLGGIGLEAAAWLVEKGARELLLAGRRPPGPEAQARIAQFESLGAKVRTAQVDLHDLAALQALLAGLSSPLRGIVHAAGVSANGLAADLTPDDIFEARRGKVLGAAALRSLTRGSPLDFVVLCSSAAGLFGAEGQSAYAAANAELEVLGAQWRRQGVPVVSVAWGPWAQAGMFAALPDQAKAAWRARGMTPMGSAQAFGALEALLAAQAARAMAANVDWARVIASEASAGRRSIFEGLAPQVRAEKSARQASDDDLARLRALPGGLQRPALIEAVAKRARLVLDLPEGAPLAASVALKDVGLDSLMAVELRNQLARYGGVALPATLAFDHPTIEAMADRLSLIWKLGPATLPPPAAATRTPPPSAVEVDLDALSEADAEALLAAELESLTAGGSPS